MINYSLDNAMRKNAILIIAALSFLIHNPTNWVLEQLYNLFICFFPFTETAFQDLSIIGIEVSQISILGIFGFAYWIFVKIIWKCKMITKLTNVPNLNGIWKGQLESSYIDPNTKTTIPPIDVTAEIVQDWNRIRIVCKFPNSTSSSQTASIRTEHEKGTVLGFSFHNQSKDVTLHTREYTGYNELTYENNCLEGIYFTNRGNGSHGNLKLNRSAQK